MITNSQNRLSRYQKYRFWSGSAAGAVSCLVFLLYYFIAVSLVFPATSTRGEFFGFILSETYEWSILLGVIDFCITMAGYLFFTRRMRETNDPMLGRRNIRKLRIFLAAAIFLLPLILIVAPMGTWILFNLAINFLAPASPGSYECPTELCPPP